MKHTLLGLFLLVGIVCANATPDDTRYAAPATMFTPGNNNRPQTRQVQQGNQNPYAAPTLPMRSMRMYSSGMNFSGDLHPLFDYDAPSSYNPVAPPSMQAQGPRQFDRPDDYGQGPTPIGEPWIMAIFALLFAGAIAIRVKRSQTIKCAENSTMKDKQIAQNKTLRSVAVALMLVFGAATNSVWGVDCYYRGSDNGWGYTKMTVSADGSYHYYQSSNNTNQFKISRTTDGWDYNYSYVHAGFNSTDITQIGDYSSNNCYCWYSGTYYILIYHPNTAVNTTGNPKICACTYLPDNRSVKIYYVNSNDWAEPIKAYAWNTGNDQNSAYGGQDMSAANKTYHGKSIYYKELNKSYNNIIFNSNSSGTDKTGDLTLGHDKDGKLYYNDGTDHWVTYQYDVELDPQGGSGGTDSIIAVCGSAMPSGKTAPTRAGYNFGGYYTSQNGGGTCYYTATMTSANTWPSDGSGPTTLYAKWTAKSCTVTLNYQESADGYNSSGSIGNAGSLSATYGNAMTALTGTMPTAKTYYAFDGFYSLPNGRGTKYYNADGSSANNWAEDTESTTTLYAYYKQTQIGSITLSSTIVEPNSPITATPVISPTTSETTTICWRLLHSNGNELGEQPTFTPGSGNSVSFNAPETPGMYKIEASYHKGTGCGTGELLNRDTVNFQVAGDHSVTVRYRCGYEEIKASTSVTGKPLAWSSDINAPDILGYAFAYWVAGDGITIKDCDNDTATTATIKIKAVYDGTLTAYYTQKSFIYFKNTLGWSNVYVNFYGSSYWNNPKGSGNKNVEHRNKAMTRIGSTDVWYYDYGEESITPSLYVSFTSASQNGNGSGAENFWANPSINVVYPANYPDAIHTDKSSENGFKAATPMFVPLASQAAVVLNVANNGKANYYNAGYWTKYTSGTGYTLEIYYDRDDSPIVKSISFTSDDDLMPMQAIAALEANTTYRFQLRRGGTEDAGVYYGNTGTMTYANHGADVAWDMSNSSFTKAKITTNAAGDYTFKLSYAGHAAVDPHYRLRIAVDYPIANGDYQVIYKDNVHSLWKPSAIVPKVANGKDTVSFFIRPGQTPYMNIQQASVNATTGAISWSNYYSVTDMLKALPKDSVYNICLKMNGSGGISVENIEAYKGNYYIRTDCANSKWDNYRSDPDHLMTYSEYSITHGGYSHYYAHWVDLSDAGRKNVKFCIANDYSPCISDTLARETASGTWEHIDDYIEEGGDLKRNANVRFMWDRHTNTISRAYIDGAYTSGSNFLALISGDSKILNINTSAVQGTTTFSDNENWIYEANVKAKPNALIKLRSIWGDSGDEHPINQYFKGSATTTVKLIEGSGTDPYDIRLIYDFKTNRLVAAWVPNGEIATETPIHADVMFIREHQGDVAQLTFSGSGNITDIKTAYGVLRFNKWTLNNKSTEAGHAPLASPLSRYERDLYWVSFPFRVSMEEVFGFGTYGTHWIIEYYDGVGRAANGFWAESDTNWKLLWDRKGKFFEPNQGYIIALELEELTENSSIWSNNNERAELYFPSYGEMSDITSGDATYQIPSHECTINWCQQYGYTNPEYDRTVRDSHWNLISVPTYVNTNNLTFASTDWITSGDGHVGPNFLYAWNPDDNSLTPTSGAGYTYRAMHAYLVQYYGNITWHSSVSPAAAPQRNPGYKGSYEFRLELQQGDQNVDQSFIRMTDDEEVTPAFDFNHDLIKQTNVTRANIYTFIDDLKVAGNCLPLNEQTTVVPVGVRIVAEDDYTFAMPDGTDGVGVTLVDTETGIRTSLSALAYTIHLEEGIYDGRFYLEMSPVHSVPTGEELITNNEANGVRKVLIDGKLYIVQDGKLFDARGLRIE